MTCVNLTAKNVFVHKCGYCELFFYQVACEFNGAVCKDFESVKFICKTVGSSISTEQPLIAVS